MLDFGFYNMDCMDGMKEFPDQFFDLAIVDPPYGINVGQSSTANLRGGSEQQICTPGGGNKTYIPFGGKKKQDDHQLRIEGGYNEHQSEVQSRSEIMVGGGLLSRPKFTRHSMTATHRMPSISKNCQEWQRKQSYGAGTIFSTISVLLSV